MIAASVCFSLFCVEHATVLDALIVLSSNVDGVACCEQ